MQTTSYNRYSKREAISYGRFSSGQQEEGDSTNRQSNAYDSVLNRYSERLERSERFGFGVLFDKGVSGFHGAHLKQGGELARFLDLLHTGIIDPHKSALVIEMWSRFGRIAPDLAMKILSDIVRSGCHVVVYSPDMYVTECDLASQQFVIIAMMLQQAHVESADKSRIGKANRQRIRETGLTKKGKRLASCPSWLNVSEDGKSYVKNDKAALLEQAVEMAIAGKGACEIRRKLGVEDRKDWSGLTSILRNPALKGEMTQTVRTDCNGNRREVATLENYYPPIIDEDTWRRLQASQDAKKKQKRGRQATEPTPNLFSGLLYDGCGQKLLITSVRNYAHKHAKVYDRKMLKPANGKGKRIEYGCVESALLNVFCSLTTSDLSNQATEQEKALANIDASIANAQSKIAKVQRQMSEATNDDLVMDAGLGMIASEQRKIVAWKAERENLLTKQAVEKVDMLEQTRKLSEHLKTLEGQERNDARAKLNALIASMVKRIDLTIVDSTTCEVSVAFTSGKVYRFGRIEEGKPTLRSTWALAS